MAANYVVLFECKYYNQLYILSRYLNDAKRDSIRFEFFEVIS